MPKGSTLTVPRSRNQGFIAHSVIGAVNCYHMLSYTITEHYCTKDDFMHWFENYLLPHVGPYPGPNSVIVFDNCSVHDWRGVEDMVERRGGVAVWLPAFSPDKAPVEKVWAAIEGHLRRNLHLYARNAIYERLIAAILDSATEAMLRAYFSHAGYKTKAELGVKSAKKIRVVILVLEVRRARPSDRRTAPDQPLAFQIEGISCSLASRSHWVLLRLSLQT